MENIVSTKAMAAGAEYTVIRAGTLKGGATGSSLSDAGGGGAAYIRELHLEPVVLTATVSIVGGTVLHKSIIQISEHASPN